MGKQMNIDNLLPAISVLSPSAVGCAFRVLLSGGSSLSDAARVKASGSGYLMNKSGDEIMALVAEFERRVSDAGVAE